MSTLFVGRLRNKGDKLIAASPQIAQGFQQASDALRQFEADRQNQMKQDFLKLQTAADIAGGWAYLPPESQNEIPRVLGIDLPRDPVTGDVKIEKTFDNLISEAARRRAMADPEMLADAAMVKEGIYTRMTNPADRQLAIEKINSDFRARQLTADLGYRKEYLRDKLARGRLAQQHGYDMEEIYARNQASGKRGRDFSEMYLDDNGDPISTQEKYALDQEGYDTSSFMPLTMDQAKVHSQRYRDRTSRFNQESQAEKRDWDIALLQDKVAEAFATDPNMDAAGKQLEQALKTGDKSLIRQAQLQIQGMTDIIAQEARDIDPENFQPAFNNLWGYWQDEKKFAEFLAKVSQRRSEDARNRVRAQTTKPAAWRAGAGPEVQTGMVGDTPFTFSRIDVPQPRGGRPGPAHKRRMPVPGHPEAERVPDNLQGPELQAWLASRGVQVGSATAPGPRESMNPMGDTGMSVPADPGWESYEEPGPTQPTPTTTIPAWRGLRR